MPVGLLGVDVVVEDGAFHGGEGVHLEVGGAQQFFELTHGGGGLDFEHYAADIKPLHAGHAGLLRSEYALPQKLTEGSGIGVGDKAQRRRIAVLEVEIYHPAKGWVEITLALGYLAVVEAPVVVGHDVGQHRMCRVIGLD